MSDRIPPEGAWPPEVFTKAVIDDADQLQLVLAGAGAGKTYLFKEVLAARPGTNLAITFINALVTDLEKELSGLASVNTFHGYAKHLLHQNDSGGLTRHFDYYPASLGLVALDLDHVYGVVVSPSEVRSTLQRLDDPQELLDRYFAIANYYDVVGHDDAVYRITSYFDAHPEKIPTLGQVVVDEVQDFCPLEMALIRQLASKGRIVAAGDDDQALYDFKQASPASIRDLPSRGYKQYELPYCFRCTSVIVEAVHDVIETASGKGMLRGRLSKKYWPHVAKGADSQAFPRIKAVLCSTDTTRSPYPARYVRNEIAKIPVEDIESSRKGNYPTAMVIGPKWFLPSVETVLRPLYPNNLRARSSDPTWSPLLDGYERLGANPNSRFGWRLVAHADPPAGFVGLIRQAVLDKKELAQLLPENYRNAHLGAAEVITKLLSKDEVAPEALKQFLARVGIEEGALREALRLDPTPPTPEEDSDKPTIQLTTFTSAKGRSASHVFVIGMINGHFPEDPAHITDTEVSQFIVALTRTRKQCHLVASSWYADGPCRTSVFFDYIGKERFDYMKLDKAQLGATAQS